MTQEDLMPRVEKGAAWLDVQMPGWFQKIDMPTLALYSCSECVLGQLFGHYTIAQRRFDLPFNEAFLNGFDLEWGEARSSNYDLLRGAWIQVIAQRQQWALEAASKVDAVVASGELVELDLPTRA